MIADYSATELIDIANAFFPLSLGRKYQLTGELFQMAAIHPSQVICIAELSEEQGFPRARVSIVRLIECNSNFLTAESTTSGEKRRFNLSSHTYLLGVKDFTAAQDRYNSIRNLKEQIIVDFWENIGGFPVSANSDGVTQTAIEETTIAELEHKAWIGIVGTVLNYPGYLVSGKIMRRFDSRSEYGQLLGFARIPYQQDFTNWKEYRSWKEERTEVSIYFGSKARMQFKLPTAEAFELDSYQKLLKNIVLFPTWKDIPVEVLHPVSAKERFLSRLVLVFSDRTNNLEGCIVNPRTQQLEIAGQPLQIMRVFAPEENETRAKNNSFEVLYTDKSTTSVDVEMLLQNIPDEIQTWFRVIFQTNSHFSSIQSNTSQDIIHLYQEDIPLSPADIHLFPYDFFKSNHTPRQGTINIFQKTEMGKEITVQINFGKESAEDLFTEENEDSSKSYLVDIELLIQPEGHNTQRYIPQPKDLEKMSI